MKNQKNPFSIQIFKCLYPKEKNILTHQMLMLFKYRVSSKTGKGWEFNKVFPAAKCLGKQEK